MPPLPADALLTVKDLSGGDSPARRNHLAVFALVPGSEIRLLQRYPSFVAEIGETILALDADVAGDIVVARAH